DPPHRGDDVNAELDQLLAQRPHLGPRPDGARRLETYFLHQHIGRCREQDAQLVGPEARAAGATDLQSDLELLDAVLGLAALAVDPLVESAWRAGQFRDDEARVVLGFLPRMTYELGPVDHAPRAFPGLG